MKKKLFYQLSVLAAFALLTGSCSKQSADYTASLPADAQFVVSANFNNLAQKADLGSEENQAVIQKFVDAMKTETDAASFQRIESLVKDPALSGIDVKSPVYVFMDGNMQVGLLAKVADEDKLASLLQSAQQQNLTGSIQEGDGFRYSIENDRNILAFNSSTLLTLAVNTDDPQLKDKAAALLSQDKEQSLTANKGFQKLMQKQGDVSLYMPASAYLTLYRHMGISLPDNIPADYMQLMEKGVMLATLDFEDGKMGFNAESYTDDPQLQAIFDSAVQSTYPIKNKYLDRLPQSTLMVFSFGVNGEKYMELVEDKMKGLMDTGQMSPAQWNMLKQALSLFDGEVTGGLTGIDYQNSMPFFTIYADAKDDAALEQLRKMFEELGLPLQPQGDKQYGASLGKLQLAMGMEGKTLWLTNDPASIGKRQEPNAAANAYAADLKGKNVGMVIDINAICAMPIVQTMAQFGGAKAQAYLELCQKMTYLEGASKGQEGTFFIKLKDEKANALKQTVDAIRTLAGL